MTVVHEAPGAPETPVADNAVDTNAEGSAPTENAEGQAKPKPERTEVPRSVINRIGALTRKHEEALREAATWRERYESSRQQQPQQPQQQPQQREPQVDPNEQRAEAVRQAKLEMRAEQVLTAGRNDPNFINAVGTLTALGMGDSELAVIFDGDDPAKVIAHLGGNPDEAAEIFAKSPAAMARALAKLESKLSAPDAVSAAPDPLKPVRNAATKSEPKPGTPEWVAWRNKQVAERKGRA